MRKRRGEKVLRAVRPSAGIRDCYQQKVDALVSEMVRSYAYWLGAAYKASPPVMAQDASPTVELMAVLRRLGRHWTRRWNSAAPLLARYFSVSIARRSDRVLRKILKDAGISVEFQMTRAMNDVLQATIAENVGLIKSIPQQFHTQVQGMTMRSVQSGRDLAQLYGDLRKQFGVTKRRAKLISLDQNNKATSALMRVRQMESGIEEAVWLHSHAGKKPRPTHVANDGKRYNVSEGWFDPDPKVRKRIWPGQLINCRCVSKPVVKGFS